MSNPDNPENENKPARRKRGAPSIRTPEIEEEILYRIAHGESLTSVCADPKMPDYATVWRWGDKDEEFRNKFARARTDQAEYFADECMEIADSAVDRDSAAAARVKIDVRMRRAAQLKPKTFAEKAGDVNVSVGVVVSTEEQRAEMIERRKEIARMVRPALEERVTDG